MPKRPSKKSARRAIEAFLQQEVPGYPTYSLCEDGVDGWAFWIVPSDDTSYVHNDLEIEWYGTGWPDNYEYNGEYGKWTERPEPEDATP